MTILDLRTDILDGSDWNEDTNADMTYIGPSTPFSIDISVRWFMHMPCRYWTYGTSGTRKGTCWVKSSKKGDQPQDDRESGSLASNKNCAVLCTNCQDPSLFSKKTDYQGSDLIKGGVPVASPKECCKKCQETKQCKYVCHSTSTRSY